MWKINFQSAIRSISNRHFSLKWSDYVNRMIKTNKLADTHSSASFHRDWKVFSGSLLILLSISNLKRTELLSDNMCKAALQFPLFDLCWDPTAVHLLQDLYMATSCAPLNVDSTPTILPEKVSVLYTVKRELPAYSFMSPPTSEVAGFIRVCPDSCVVKTMTTSN